MKSLERDLYAEKPTVIVLAGGKGTRLYPLTLGKKPKPLIPLVNRPILLLTMENLARQDCFEYIFSVKGEENYSAVKDYFKYGEGFSRRLGLEKDVRFRYQPNYNDAGDADGFKSCLEFYNVQNDTLVIGGDNIADLDLGEMIRFHKEKNALVTIGLKSKEDVTGLGVVVMDDDYRVTNFVEKPQRGEEPPSKLINAGIYLISPRIREVLKDIEIEKMIKDRTFGFGRNLFPYLVKKGERVYGYRFAGLWSDVGTIDSYVHTTADILHGNYENIRFREEYQKEKGIWIHPSTAERIKNKKITLMPPVAIGGDCEIGENVTIQKNSVIGDNCIIGNNVQINASTIMHCTNIGSDARLNECIVGTYSEVLSSESSPTIIDVGAVIGNNTTIESGSKIRVHERVAQLRFKHEILEVKSDKKQVFKDLGEDETNFYFSD